MKTREEKDRERREREAAWAAEDAAVRATGDPIAALGKQADEAWRSGQPVFVVRTVAATMQVRIEDRAQSDDLLAGMLATVEQVGWELSKMSHYVTRDITNSSECGVFIFKRAESP